MNMMLRKSLIAAVACLSLAPALRAQQTTDSVYTVEVKDADKYRVETNRFGANWFAGGIGIRLGANGYKIKGASAWTGHNNPVAPGVNRGNYGGFIVDWNPATRTGKLNQYATDKVGYPVFETEQQYIHAHADVLFNVTQMVCGYNEDRFYSLIPYAGLGFATTLERASTTGRHSTSISVVLMLVTTSTRRTFLLRLQVFLLTRLVAGAKVS